MSRLSAMVVPKRFEMMVALHLVKNLTVIEGFRPPLILGIQGPSGEGKTFQCELVFERMKVSAVRLFARDFESSLAGEPGRLLFERYCEASEFVTKRGRSAVLFINDLDVAVGRWQGDVQTTVNTQIAIGTLMSIADYPELVGERRTVRVPIVVTGNDFKKLYDPLTREGRMEIRTWIPTPEEKAQVVRANILSDGFLSDEDVASLVLGLKHRPIAFFSLLKSKLVDVRLEELIEEVGVSQILSTPGAISGLRIDDFDRQTLIDLAHKIDSEEVSNYLRG